VKQIPGGEIRILRNDKQVSFDEEGFLGRFSEGKLTLSILTNPVFEDVRIAGLVVNEKPGEPLTVAVNIGIKGEDDKELHSRPVGIVYSHHYGCAVTHSNRNYLSFLELKPASRGGGLVLWEVAIVSQKGNFFVTVQDKYRASVFLHDGRVTCPEMSRWPELVSVIDTLYRETGDAGYAGIQHLASAEDIAEQSHREELRLLNRKQIKKGEAKVVFWDERKVFGVLQAPDREARFSIGQAVPRPGQRRVHFDPGETVFVKSYQRNKEANEGQIQWDAVGVQPLSL